MGWFSRSIKSNSRAPTTYSPDMFPTNLAEFNRVFLSNTVRHFVQNTFSSSGEPKTDIPTKISKISNLQPLYYTTNCMWKNKTSSQNMYIKKRMYILTQCLTKQVRNNETKRNAKDCNVALKSANIKSWDCSIC